MRRPSPVPAWSDVERVEPGEHLLFVHEDLVDACEGVARIFARGAEQNQFCLYVRATNSEDAVASQLIDAGLDVERLLKKDGLRFAGGLSLVQKTGFSIPGRVADLYRMVADARERGFDGVYLAVEAHAYTEVAKVPAEVFVEYEHLVNERFFQETGTVAICQYERARFPEPVIQEALRSHSRVITGDLLCENPFWEPRAPGLRGARLETRLEALRRLRAEELARASAEEEPVAGARRGLKVLIVDCESDGAALLAELLSLEGHDTRVVRESASASEIGAKWHPDAVFFSIDLPESNVRAAVDRLHELEPRRPVLVAVTGHGSKEDIDRSRRAGFDRYLVKPLYMSVLRQLLREMPGSE